MSYNVWLSDDHRYSMAFRLSARKPEADAACRPEAEPAARPPAERDPIASASGAAPYRNLARQLASRLITRTP